MRDRSGLLASVALILVTNLVVLAGVLFNRTGQPDAAITLTERELPVAWQGREDTGIALDLRWERLGPGFMPPERRWLDRAKLEALGFDCSVPEGDSRAGAFYGKAIPRKALVVLEYEGKAWKDSLLEKETDLRNHEEKVRQGEEPPERAESARMDLELARSTRSRLFAVDVGRDAGILRRKYPDRERYIIAEWKVALLWTRPFGEAGKGSIEPEPPRLWGNIQEISISRIHVPRNQAALLGALRRGDEVAAAAPVTGLRVSPQGQEEREPRYRVRVIFGRRLEPWVEQIEPTGGNPLQGSGAQEGKGWRREWDSNPR